MSEINKVLEAEKTIHDIASELEKMKSAADLLNSAQDKTEEVIKASEAIVTKMNEFVTQGADIVSKIADYDIQAEMMKLIDLLDGVETKIESRAIEIEKGIHTNYFLLIILGGINLLIGIVLILIFTR